METLENFSNTNQLLISTLLFMQKIKALKSTHLAYHNLWRNDLLNFSKFCLTESDYKSDYRKYDTCRKNHIGNFE